MGVCGGVFGGARGGARALVGSRYNIEIDWAGPRVCAAYPRESLGYLHVLPQCGAPAA